MRERWTTHAPILQIETYTFNLQVMGLFGSWRLTAIEWPATVMCVRRLFDCLRGRRKAGFQKRFLTPFPLEIKAGETINPDYFRGLRAFARLYDPPPPNGGALVYGGDESQTRHDTMVMPITGVHRLLQSLSLGSGPSDKRREEIGDRR